MQELLRLESAWHRAVCLAISHLGAKTFHVVYKNRPSALSLGNLQPHQYQTIVFRMLKPAYNSGVIKSV